MNPRRLRKTPLAALLTGAAIVVAAPTVAHDDARRTELFGSGVVHAETSTSGTHDDVAPDEGYGDFGMRIRTSSAEARRHFDRGIGLLWGFNHAAAVTAFRAAQAADPDCALCHWAEGYALGPNLNDGMHPENEAPALAAARRAKGLARTPREGLMALALVQRYDPELPDRPARDAAFADAIGDVAERFATDENLQVIAADALMNLQPWDYWETDGVTPKGNGAEILATLERALELAPEHPAALHLYIHAVEASADPARAEAAADTLRGLVPAAGHLVHMPAHIYSRIGRHADSIAVNRDAIAADERYLATAGAQASPLYRFGYYPHNVHFLLVGAQNAGLADVALEAADKLAAITSDKISSEIAWVQAIRTAPYSAHAQFSDPDTILSLPAPNDAFPFVRGFRHYARGTAFVDEGALGEATGEVEALGKILTEADFSTLEEQYLPASDVLGLATHLLEGRIEAARGDWHAARHHLDEAIALEATIPYMEPVYWPTPVHRTLGAVELQADRPARAIAAFETALRQAPRDAWALWGLLQASEAAGIPAAELETLRARHAEAWLGDDALLTLGRL